MEIFEDFGLLAARAPWLDGKARQGDFPRIITGPLRKAG